MAPGRKKGPNKTRPTEKAKPCHSPSKDPPEDTGDEIGVIKSPLDPKGYLAVQFKNGLKALVISSLPHELDVDDEESGGINPETGVFCKVETFNRLFVHIPEQNNGPKTKRSKSKGDGDSEDDDCKSKAWVPEIKPNVLAKNPKSQGFRRQDFSHLAFVCVTIGAGSIHDPDEFHGMAHICEHACASFGSAKYPCTNLMEAVRAAKGMVNAMTFQQTTCYVFIVNFHTTGKAGFERLLDILSDSIANTNIEKDRLAEEVKAVDCESGLREAHDVLRLWMLLCSTVKSNHPFARFGCGNSSTLANDKLYKALLKWKERHYAANYMSVSIKAPLPVQELKEIVAKYFSTMKSSPLPSPRNELTSNHKNPFNGSKEFNKIYKVVPVKGYCQLMTMTWVLDAKFASNDKTQPFVYLDSFFNPGSPFMDYLSQHHWAYYVSASRLCCTESNDLCSIFCLMFQLTDAGVNEHESIIHAVFCYLKMLVDVGPQEDIFNDIRRDRADSFHYDHQASLFHPNYPCLFELVGLSATLVGLDDLKFILTTRALITEFDPKIIQECTKSLTPRNLNVMICSKSFEEICGLKEKWHGTKYAKEALRERLVKDCENIDKNDYKKFRLPKVNQFRQRNIACPVRGCQLPPIVEETSKMAAVYYQVDLCMNGRLPEGLYHVSIASPLTSPNLITYTLLEVWLMMMRSQLRTEIYAAQNARIMTTAAIMPSCTNTFNFILEGPPACHGEIFKSMVDTFKCFNVQANPQDFEDQKELCMKFFKDMTLDPWCFANDLLSFTLRMQHRLLDQVVSEVQTVCIDGFDNFIKRFKSRMYVQLIVVGCIEKHYADAAQLMIESLDYGELPEILSQDLQRAMLLPQGERCLRVKSRNSCDPTSRVVNHYQFGNIHPQVACFIAQLLGYPAFARLRTEEHLSYAVFVRPEFYCGCTGLSIIVAPQPHLHTTGYVDERIDQFLCDFRQELASNERLAQVLPFFNTFLMPDGQGYRKLSVQVMAPLNKKRQDACGSPNGPMQPTKLNEKIAKVNKRPCDQIWSGARAPPKRGDSLDLGIDVPKDYQHHNGYFITDLVDFKESLIGLGRDEEPPY